MKRFRFVLLLLLLALPVGAADLLVPMSDFGLTALGKRQVTLTLLTTNVANGRLISREAKKQDTSPTGETVFSNVISGTYKLDFASTPPTTFYVDVPATNGLISAANYFGVPTNLAGGITAYSKQQVDEYLASIQQQIDDIPEGGPGGGTAVATDTNSGVNLTTNGPVVRIEADVKRPNLTDGSARNAAVAEFTNIVELIASPYTNRVAFLRSYWGSNDIGKGWLRWSTNAATTNLFDTFPSAYGGYWKRTDRAANEYRLDWGGPRPINSNDPATINDSYRLLTNILAVAGNNYVLRFPNYEVAITDTLVVKDSYGFKWTSDSGAKDDRQMWSVPAPRISWLGPNGVPMLVISNSQRGTIENLCLHTSTPIHPSLGQITNNAISGIDIDQSPPGTYSQIATKITFNNVAVQGRGTNLPAWYGFRVSPTSLWNCEDITFNDCYVKGPGYLDLHANVLSYGSHGIAFYIGNSANARGINFYNCKFDGVKYGVYNVSGSYSFREGLATGALADFYIHSSVGPILIEGMESEEQQMAVLIDPFGVGSTQNEKNQVILRNNQFFYTSSGNRRADVPIIPVQSSVNLILEGNTFMGNADQLMFAVTNIATANLYTEGNIYPTNQIRNLSVSNFSSFDMKDTLRDGNIMSSHWVKNPSGVEVAMHPIYKTNQIVWQFRNAAINISPSNSAVFFGVPPPGLSADRFVFWPPVSQWNAYWGDDFLLRHALRASGNGRLDVDFRSTNGQPAMLSLIHSNRQQLSLSADNQNIILNARNAPLFIQQNGNSTLTVANDGTLTLAATNNQTLVNSTNIDLQGTATIRSNLFVGLGATVGQSLVVGGTLTVQSNALLAGSNVLNSLLVSNSVYVVTRPQFSTNGAAQILNVDLSVPDAVVLQTNALTFTNIVGIPAAGIGAQVTRKIIGNGSPFYVNPDWRGYGSFSTNGVTLESGRHYVVAIKQSYVVSSNVVDWALVPNN